MKKYVEKFQSLENGQKIKVIIVVVVLIIIIYMISGLFGGNSSSNYRPSTVVNNQNKLPPPQLVANVVQKQSIAKPDIILNNLNEKQMAYLKAVNELQMLQLQQQIAQTKQQIAQAELQAAQSNKQLQSIISPPPPPLFANQDQSQSAQSAAVVAPTITYQLEYLANQGGKWQVILSNNGNLINATMGTVLPDGSTITNISGTSVTLMLHNQTKVLTIAPSF